MAPKSNPVVFIRGLWLHASHGGMEELSVIPATTPWLLGGPVTRTLLSWPAPTGLGRQQGHRRRDRPLCHHHRSPSRPTHSRRAFLWGHDRRETAGDEQGSGRHRHRCRPDQGRLRLPLSALHATLPVFKNPANKHRAVSLTAEQFRSSFGNALSEEESNELYEKWAVPSPGRPLLRPRPAASRPIHRKG